MARYKAGIPLAVNEIAPEGPVFGLYPNPATDEVTIALPADVNSSMTLRVYDNIGKKIEEVSLVNGGNGSIDLDLSRFGSGFYIVTLSYGKSVSSGKLVIVR
jgi:hypothetical protein